MKRTILFLALTIMLATYCYSQKSKKPKVTLAFADSLFTAQQYLAAAPMYVSLLTQPEIKTNAITWNRLGVSYFNLKKYGEAISAFQEVYKINPKFQFLFINFAKSYAASNNVTKAIQMIDSAISRGGFGNYKLLENDPAFANLKADSRYKDVYDRVYKMAYPCMSIPESRQFDFWLGEWDVFVTANMSIKAGVNKITLESGGCVVLESWEATGPHKGVSINYYDPSDSAWHEYWSGSGQDILKFYDGKFENNAMRFKWDSPNQDGTMGLGRLTFSKLDNGNVRQHSERSSDQGKTWQTVYDFTYIKRKKD